jgi:hypothetical protein
MDSTREMLEAAFALDDEAKRNFEQWKMRQAAQVKKRSGDDGLVYKTNDRALVEKPAAEQPLFSPEQVAVLGYTISELRQEWRQHVATEIQKLRAELEHDSDDKILEWPTRKRTDAA